MSLPVEVSRPPFYERVLASATAVNEVVGGLACSCLDRYDEDTLFVCMQQGGVPFGSRLMFGIAAEALARGSEFSPQLDYMQVGAYGTGQVAGEARIIRHLGADVRLKDRRVVLVDEALDGGGSSETAARDLEERGARDVELVVLFEKDVSRDLARTRFLQATLRGLVTPDVWLLGMGLDDPRIRPEFGRWLPFLAEGLSNQRVHELRAAGVI